MKTHPLEIQVYYNDETRNGKQIIAYANSISRYIKEYPFTKANLTPMQWRSLLSSMNVEPKKIFNKAHPEYQEKISGKNFDDDGWLNVLSHHTHLIDGAIVVKGKKTIYCKSPTDIFRILQVDEAKNSISE